ncbi:MAG: DUF2806 domain-containing protein [Bacteroidaceae bacterium]|nr:DUF2806 domain-containing protein [Bacteroidaceae bacterium]
MEGLIKIEGKPLEKLIEVVSNGIGTLYRPRAIKNEADAKAYAIKVIEKAKHEAIAEGKLIEAENLDRINERLVAKEIKRQNNIDDVIELAVNDLNQTESIIDVPVEQDWSTRFFDIVQDVSDNEMKILWGKILAGEVKRPKSYSLRTLELLRNLSKEEADIFVKVSQFVLKQNDYFIFDGDEMSQLGISYIDIAKLTEIGLIQAGTFVHKEYKSLPDKDNKIGIQYKDYVIIISIQSGADNISLPINCLTTAGKELYQLIDVTPNIDYIKIIGDYIKKQKASAEYSKIYSINHKGGISYQTPTIKI